MLWWKNSSSRWRDSVREWSGFGSRTNGARIRRDRYCWSRFSNITRIRLADINYIYAWVLQQKLDACMDLWFKVFKVKRKCAGLFNPVDILQGLIMCMRLCICIVSENKLPIIKYTRTVGFCRHFRSLHSFHRIISPLVHNIHCRYISMTSLSREAIIVVYYYSLLQDRYFLESPWNLYDI